MPARPTTAAVLALAVAGAVAGCGSSSSSKDNSTAATVASPAGSVGVTYQDYDASPKTITVKLGASVTWTNKDGAPHNVVSTAGPTGDRINSPAISQGGTFTFTPSVAGTVSYVCTFHPQMKGYSVVVTR